MKQALLLSDDDLILANASLESSKILFRGWKRSEKVFFGCQICVFSVHKEWRCFILYFMTKVHVVKNSMVLGPTIIQHL